MAEENLGSLKDCYVIQENGKKALAVTGGGQALDVVLQDQSTPTLITKFNQIHNSTTLSAEVTKEGYDITVSDPTGIVVGSYIIIFSSETGRYYFGQALVIVSSVITLDTPLDSTFPIGANVDIAITDMSVDGSSTVQVFGIRGSGPGQGVDVDVDITRIIFSCIASSAVDLSLFANIAKLTRGLVLRKRDGVIHNIFNVKSNGEIDGITLDWVPYSATNPQQGVDGFSARLTFASQGKLGVVQRLSAGEDLEFLNQDNLTGITLLEVYAEGSEVER